MKYIQKCSCFALCACLFLAHSATRTQTSSAKVIAAGAFTLTGISAGTYAISRIVPPRLRTAVPYIIFSGILVAFAYDYKKNSKKLSGYFGTARQYNNTLQQHNRALAQRLDQIKQAQDDQDEEIEAGRLRINELYAKIEQKNMEAEDERVDRMRYIQLHRPIGVISFTFGNQQNSDKQTQTT
ncbi:MAG: hypothetical protein UU47_C0011G0005 [candidate division TM6 bacterium GW2011_GWE2_41_16]|nr:MAG: hypothetical protein UU47_C0011G0005 [candidate division TM6 bacterium GW2011_GWE2_41_16]